MTTPPVDRFGFPLRNAGNLFTRPDFRPDRTLPWQPGSLPNRTGPTHFNHVMSFEYANESQLLRDLALLKGATGRPMFEMYVFELNGRQLPIEASVWFTPHAVPPTNGHPELLSALRTDSWFGQLNESWLETRNAILSNPSNDGATVDQLRQQLNQAAQTFKPQVDERLAVLQAIQFKRIGPDGFRPPVDINTPHNGSIRSFEEYVRPTIGGQANPYYEPNLKTERIRDTVDSTGQRNRLDVAVIRRDLRWGGG